MFFPFSLDLWSGLFPASAHHSGKIADWHLFCDAKGHGSTRKNADGWICDILPPVTEIFPEVRSGIMESMTNNTNLPKRRWLLAAVCILTLAAMASAQTAASLEARLQKVEDILAIQQLLANYMTYMDASDYASYAELFAADGELIFQTYRLKGPKAIRELMEQGSRSAAAKKSASQPGGLLHMMSSMLIRVDGDRATNTARWIVMSQGADGRPVVGATGHYEDSLRRIGGQWKFQRRVIYTDFPYQSPPKDADMR